MTNRELFTSLRPKIDGKWMTIAILPEFWQPMNIFLDKEGMRVCLIIPGKDFYKLGPMLGEQKSVTPNEHGCIDIVYDDVLVPTQPAQS